MTTRDKLETLAANMWWSWNPEALDLFQRLNPEAFRRTSSNPVAALKAAAPDVLGDAAYQADVDHLYDRFQEYLHAPSANADGPQVSYFCMEFGLHESLPTYAGGLGILAGDHCKAASDLGLRFTAIGLFLREGYFEQRFDHSGWQQEVYAPLDPSMHPFQRVTDEAGDAVVVTAPIGPHTLHLQAWRLDIGRTRLFLLDSNLEANPEHLRNLTEKLYQGDRVTRIQQEIVLGIGGVRLLRALGIPSDVYHMNEGHCAFLALELLRERLAGGEARADAEAWVREQCVFTTHTPVMAGHDRFAPDIFVEQMQGFREQIGLNDWELLGYGRVNPDDPNEAFTMTVLGLKLARQSNGVSALNGEVARRQWHHMYPERPVEEVPIGSVTNGIHLPTWAVRYAQRFLTERFGDWTRRRLDPGFWERVREISDADLWAYRCRLRADLVDYVAERAPRQSLPLPHALDPNALTIGFARRFATYKRAPLLFFDYERAAQLFANTERPVQMIYAGKAHPADEGGKRFIQQIYEFSRHDAFRGKLLILENYNMEVGRMLVSGTDIWLNNPRRPMEASGTSGQKVAIHGGLNVSILDGWWPEGYNGHNGWTIGFDASADYKDPYEQDMEDANFLYDVLENQVAPAFYDRNEQNLPLTWIAYMRSAMETLTFQFSAARMVGDYIEQIYAAPISSSVAG